MGVGYNPNPAGLALQKASYSGRASPFLRDFVVRETVRSFVARCKGGSVPCHNVHRAWGGIGGVKLTAGSGAKKLFSLSRPPLTCRSGVWDQPHRKGGKLPVARIPPRCFPAMLSLLLLPPLLSPFFLSFLLLHLLLFFIFFFRLFLFSLLLILIFFPGNFLFFFPLLSYPVKF